MSISDTKNAQKYASIAETAAAQAKIYADKLEDAPDYAAQAEAAASQASDSAQSALTAQNGANAAAGQASDSANEAVQAAADAEGAAEAVFGSSLHAPTGEVLSTLPSAAGRVNTVPVFDGSGDATVKAIADFAILDSNGKIPVSMIPAVALSEVFVVNSQAAMLALDAQEGDVAKRTDLGYSFILASEPASTLSNWVQVSDDVLAQLGLSTGATEVGAVDDDNNSTTVQGALALKASKAYLSANTGATRVNTSSGVTVQQALDDINNTIPQLPYDYYIGSFFASNTDDRLSLFSSHDGKTFTKINANGLTPINTSVVGNRDPSIIFYKGKWYVSCTTGGTGNVGSTDADFLIYRSDDLISWQLVKCLAGPTKLKGQPGSVIGGTIATIAPIWAPSLLEKDGELWVQLSIGYKPQAADIDGKMVNWCAPFACRCNNIDNLTFDFPQLMMTDTSVQRIDVEVTKIPTGYAIAIKNEYNKHIEIWKSATYIGGYTKVADLNFGGVYVEGPSLVWINTLQKWRLYADAFQQFGTTYYVESADLATWTAPAVVQSPWPLRHGTILNLANCSEPRKAIDSFTIASNLMSSDEIPPCWAEGGTLVAGTNTIVPKCNYVYRVGGSTQATVTINEAGGDWFYLLVASGTEAAGITVNGTKVDGSFSVGFGQSNLRLFKLRLNKVSGLYQLDGMPNVNGDSASLQVANGWPTVNSGWKPKHGRIYTTSGSMGTTTIASLPTDLPDGTTFYLWIGSGNSGGSVVFKAGGAGIGVYGRDLILSGAMGHGDALHRVTKLGGYWRVTVSGPTDFEYSPLINRKAYFVGDSITAGTAGQTYATYLCESLSMTLAQNAAVGGSKMADIASQVSTLPAIGDDGVLFIATGTNDFSGLTPIGVPADATNTTKESFYRHCLLAAEAIKAKIGTATRVYFISPIARGTNSGSNGGLTIKDYADVIEWVCQAYGYGFINGSYVAQLNQKNMATLTSDNLHPNAAGAEYIGRNYARFLRNSGM